MTPRPPASRPPMSSLPPASVPPLTSMPPTAEESRAMTAVAPGTPPSEEAPVYRKVRQRRDDGTLSSLCLIECDEGWRSTVLCSGVYERDADFLLSLLGRTSRLPSVREASQ